MCLPLSYNFTVMVGVFYYEQKDKIAPWVGNIFVKGIDKWNCYCIIVFNYTILNEGGPFNA